VIKKQTYISLKDIPPLNEGVNNNIDEEDNQKSEEDESLIKNTDDIDLRNGDFFNFEHGIMIQIRDKMDKLSSEENDSERRLTITNVSRESEGEFYDEDEEYIEDSLKGLKKSKGNNQRSGKNRMSNSCGWRHGLSELSGGQKTLLSICCLIAVSKLSSISSSFSNRNKPTENSSVTEKKFGKKSLVLFDEVYLA
jgi:hypothetical protein